MVPFFDLHFLAKKILIVRRCRMYAIYLTGINNIIIITKCVHLKLNKPNTNFKNYELISWRICFSKMQNFNLVSINIHIGSQNFLEKIIIYLYKKKKKLS